MGAQTRKRRTQTRIEYVHDGNRHPSPGPVSPSDPGRKNSAMTGSAGEAVNHGGDDLAGCTRLLAEAFAHDPWANYVLAGRAAERGRAIAAIMATSVKVAHERGGLVTFRDDGPGKEGGELTAVSTWVPSTRRHIDGATILRSGLVALPLQIGLSAFGRLIRDGIDRDAALDELADNQTAYLWTLGVSARHRGLGLGRRVVDATCRAVAAHGFQTIVLNTENIDNVAIYQALGFTLVRQFMRRSGLSCYLFRRDLAPGHG